MTKLGLEPLVTFIHGDGTQGFQVPEKVDAVFIDMPSPWTVLRQAREALKDGGWFGSLVPTTNQVQDLLRGMDGLGGERAFGMIEVEEVITRGYKPVADRLRPKDRMIAHTGFLIFARGIVRPDRPRDAPASAIDEDGVEDPDLGDAALEA